MLPAAIAGFLLGLSLIVAIGAQNAFVLRQGLVGRHVGAVIAVCAGSDALLIAAGVAGAGALIAAAPALADVARIGGGLFLLGYAALAARRAARPSTLAAGTGATASLTATLGTTLALTWLNPHVYLDTVVLVGSVADSHGDARWWFALGAMVASVVWFTGLGRGAARLRGLFARPAAWRALDAGIAVVMAALGATLLLGAT